jgi:general secretion pathway protein J
MRDHLRGFTLLEVLIAITIFATVSLSIFQSMSSSFDAKRNLTALNERYHEGRQVMRRMTRDLRMAFLRAQPPEELREEEPAVITRFLGEEDEIYFPTTAHVRMRAEGKESDQSEVSYFIKKPRYDTQYRGYTLFRRESRRVDDRPEKGGLTWPVVDGIKSFKLEYWDDRKEIGNDAWQSNWDSEDNDVLPRRVRITFELERLNSRKTILFVGQASPRIVTAIQPVSEYKR